jgi:hypothetical protein
MVATDQRRKQVAVGGVAFAAWRIDIGRLYIDSIITVPQAREIIVNQESLRFNSPERAAGQDRVDERQAARIHLL